ncbi:site-specific integrase [Paenibacillus phocaensis]|uniref:hypothetical protein n=1 Tax=Paenibacillus phocaensis TaxID=1776378 RepID=UPI0022B7D6C8|nr:hypothetical protein [Paenibacillus phocaensis]
MYPKTLGDRWRAFHQKNPKLKYIRFHDLRHTSATLLISQGVHAKISPAGWAILKSEQQ